MVLAHIYMYRFETELQKRWNSVKIIRIPWGLFNLSKTAIYKKKCMIIE